MHYILKVIGASAADWCSNIASSTCYLLIPSPARTCFCHTPSTHTRTSSATPATVDICAEITGQITCRCSLISLIAHGLFSILDSGVDVFVHQSSTLMMMLSFLTVCVLVAAAQAQSRDDCCTPMQWEGHVETVSGFALEGHGTDAMVV